MSSELMISIEEEKKALLVSLVIIIWLICPRGREMHSFQSKRDQVD